MKIVLILVLINFPSGSEVINIEFDDIQACEDAALQVFDGVDIEMETHSSLPLEGPSIIYGTMVANGLEGYEIVMYSCSPSRIN